MTQRYRLHLHLELLTANNKHYAMRKTEADEYETTPFLNACHSSISHKWNTECIALMMYYIIHTHYIYYFIPFSFEISDVKYFLNCRIFRFKIFWVRIWRPQTIDQSENIKKIVLKNKTGLENTDGKRVIWMKQLAKKNSTVNHKRSDGKICLGELGHCKRHL